MVRSLTPRRDFSSAAGRWRVRSGLRLPALFGLLALAAHLLLPLAYTCATYRVRIHSCCGARPVPSVRGEATAVPEEGCPFCRAFSPFKHARFARTPVLSPVWAFAVAPAAAPLHEVFRAPPARGANQPRAPPPLLRDHV